MKCYINRKHMWQLTSWLLLLALVVAPASAAPSRGVVRIPDASPSALSVDGLTIDGRADNPLGVDDTTPDLGWRVSGGMQTAYEIRAASSAALLTTPDLWASGKVTSTQSIGILYAGTALTSRQRVVWQVRVWDELDQPSDWSAPASWEMGLLNASDWGAAKWIEYPGRTNTQPLPIFARAFTPAAGKTVRQARLYISGVGPFVASLNGRPVTDEVLAPGYTNLQLEAEYHTYDVTSLLTGGSNTLGVQLGHGMENRSRTVTNPATGRTNSYAWNQSTATGSGTIVSPTAVGATSVRPSTITNFFVDGTINVDTGNGGDNLESRTMTGVFPAASTTLVVPAAAGDTNVRVASVNNIGVGGTLNIDTGADLETVTTTAVGTGAGSTTLAAPAITGTTNVYVASVNNLTVTAPLLIDTGAFSESVTITGVGTAAAAPTTLFAPAAVGDTNVKVASTTGFTPTQQFILDTGADLEMRTVTAVGTQGRSTTLAPASTTLAVTSTTLLGPANIGDTVISVGSNSGFSAGQTIGIDSGANLESATIISITTIGLPVPSYSATPVANWIWNTAGANGGAPAGTIYVRKTFTVADPSAVTVAALRINADDQHDTYVNGTLVTSSHVTNGWQTSQLVNIKPQLITGTNVIAVAATNNAGDAGSLISAVQIDTSGGSTRIVSDATWKALAGTPAIPPAGWNTAAFDDSAWPAAFISGAYPLAPWNVLTDPPSTATYNFTLAAPLSKAHVAGAIVGAVTPAGVTNLKVASVTAFAVGNPITIDSGANTETATIASVGTSGASGTGITLTAPTTLPHTGAVAVTVIGIPAGVTNIRVASTSGFMVGHVIAIDTGASAESATITAVGTSGASGTGLTLASALTLAHANGALVATSGTPAVAATNDMPAQPAYTSAEWKAALDQSVFRILTQMNDAGLLEGTQFGTHSNGCNRSAGMNCTPYVPARPDLQAIQPDMFAAAQQIAEASAVLLKNDDNVLPLTCADLTTGNGVVLMGPTAISTYTGGGGSAHVRPFDPVQSSYDALIAAAKAKCGDAVKISYVPGYDIDGPIVPSSVLKAPDPAEGYPNWTLKPEDAAFANQPGLLRQQIMTATVPSGAQPVLYTGVDAAPDQLNATINYVGDNGLPAGTAWRWSGTLTAPVDGSYALRIFIADQAGAQLFTEGLTTSQRRINQGAYPTYFPDSMSNSYATQTVAQKTHDPDFQDGQRPNYNVTLTAGQQVHLDLRVYASATKPVRVQFRWVPTTNQADQIAAAFAAAGAANKVVDFVWDEGSEGSDRGGNAIANGLALAGYQNDVVAAVVAANPNTAVVLNTGDAVFMPWASTTKSILEMWYPGQMGGPATANVLLGNVNPGGKLPETFYDGNAPIGQRFPQDTQPAPCADNTGGTSYYGTASGALPGNPGNCPMYPGIYLPGFLGTNLHGYRTINYSDQVLGGIQGNGIFQGYRWFDKNGYTPLFPFGHGLSYTTFEYRNLVLKAEKGGTVRVSFIVQNKGDVAGTVVPQVYVGAAPSPLQQAVRALHGFDLVKLRPNEAKRVEITLDPRSFQYWDVNAHAWTFLAGTRTIWVGDSSRDLRLSGNVTPMAQ